MTILDDDERAGIRHTFDRLPEDVRAEIVDGEIIVSPFPGNPHRRIVMYLNRVFAAVLPEDWWIEASGGLVLEPDEQEYEPDLYLAPASAWTEKGRGADLAAVALVVEITSPRQEDRDRVRKYAAYARAGVPQYLLIDRYDGNGSVTLFSRPDGDVYAAAHKVPFGELLTVPTPFPVEIDSSRF
jgi:Uma2 family endonuclease